MPPEVIMAIVLQLPLVAVVAWAFTTGRVHSPAELKRREVDHEAELKRRDVQVDDWKRLYEQERGDRIEANKRLSRALENVKEVTAGVDELTREVIRASRQ